ncbi:protein of unknown function DUF1501 [Gluconacetobacter diazotrophicus PA1 5]|uniref:DUF1501 domain-containing protein n=1 Tax=Gluconacetobacter diazotrophicus TaxID=33996 RepID=A0A7W4NFM2_GLUDI|nr:DUF1501 domain-containing protein [Gluconacetobacter diazotrophicus]ACI52283.1 protein of unknown function DUF1501 [Gluconacetobacter diazotrophicus PA1 5]MBB2156836.1 DUF1501 domain-containing protein [Gluconacetobacter diazotrophicus]TWB04822.1 uncharacterized protein (DUF1501 family) [Gluconacetobacter diazotrophicus]
MLIPRRTALLGLASSWMLESSSLALARPVIPARRDGRLVVVILRGALDGMAAVVPYGDAALAAWRARLLPPEPGRPGGLLDLGGFYGLHPALATLHALYAQGALLPIHAVAGHYRSRSHFEAQDYMESGADTRLTSGWLNRAVGAMAPAPHGPDGAGLSVGLSAPLLLRGPAPIGSYNPHGGAGPDPDLLARIAALNAPDPLLGPALRAGLRADAYSAHELKTRGMEMNTGPSPAPAAPRRPDAFVTLCRTAGTLLAAPDGPRVAALEVGGWDTHAAQVGRLAGPLARLDAGLGALRDGLGTAWPRSVVLVMTEFGRTVRVNGTGGTDHGTATVALLAGGAVAGGRVAGTWPGLAAGQLFENRDLAPTTDLRAVAKGVLRDHLGLPSSTLPRIFPDSADVPPLPGLVRT